MRVLSLTHGSWKIVWRTMLFETAAESGGQEHSRGPGFLRVSPSTLHTGLHSRYAT